MRFIYMLLFAPFGPTRWSTAEILTLMPSGAASHPKSWGLFVSAAADLD
jgi:hypothetical protein